MAGRQEASAGTPATTALTRAGIEFAVHPYHHDPSAPSYGLEAAAALGVPAEQVFKTLLVETERGLGVGVVPVSASLDLKALAVALGTKKAVMAQPRDAERSTGYVLGGISPIGQRRVLPTVVDVSALAHARIYVSGGRRGLDISLAPSALIAVTAAGTAPIAR